MAGPWENYSPAEATDWAHVPMADGRPQITINARPSAEREVPESASNGPWSNYEAPRSPVDVAKGLYRAADAGAAKGVANLVGLPHTLTELGATGIGKATNFVERQLGLPESPMPDHSNSVLNRVLPSPETVAKGIQDKLYDGAEPYKPQGIAEDYARGIGEFIPGALLTPGGVMAKAAQAVVPGVFSETAGRVAKDTEYENAARTIGGLAGSGVVSLLLRPGTAARAIREELPAGITQEMVDDAAGLMARAKSQGVDLAWPEALSQTAGRPVLTNLMRHLEAAPQTEARMAEFFGQRAAQIEQAGRGAMDHLAPANASPSGIGPAVGTAAQGIVNDVRGAINKASEPLYKSAETVRLSPAGMAKVHALPGVPEAIKAVRSDPQLNRYVAHLPDDSVGFLNEVKKYLDQAAENASAPVNAARNMQRSAGYGADAAAVKDAGVRASVDYDRALQFQAQAREKYLQPILNGPLGKLAGKDTTTKAAIDTLFPANPLPNSAQEISRTVGALANKSPRAASDLVRAHVESVFNEATQALQSGANQSGGAKFAAVLRGNPQQRANLEAAVEALPNGAERLAGFNRFLEVAEATGTRQGVGSRTAYNAELLKNQSKSGFVGETAKASTNPLRVLQPLADKYEQWRLGRNLNELAAILTDPRSANQLRAIANMPVGSGRARDLAIRLATAGFVTKPGEPPQQPRK